MLQHTQPMTCAMRTLLIRVLLNLQVCISTILIYCGLSLGSIFGFTAIVGDITPSDGVPKEEKSRREREALNEMCEVLGGGMRGIYCTL